MLGVGGASTMSVLVGGMSDETVYGVRARRLGFRSGADGAVVAEGPQEAAVGGCVLGDGPPFRRFSCVEHAHRVPFEVVTPRGLALPQ
jgi:hypothetical protein